MKLTRLVPMTAGVAVFGLAATGCGGSDSGSDGDYDIGISQYTSHPSLDASAEGFKEAFEDADVEVNWDEQNAQADQSTVNSITGNFESADMDLVLSIGTPSAITAASTLTEIPLLFTAVTDPVEPGLVDDWDEPGANITGVSDMNPVEEQFDLLMQIDEDVETVGIVYSSSEANSEVQVAAAEEAADDLGLEIETSTVTNSSEVQQGVQSLGDVDAIYVPTDNAVVSSLETVVSYGEDQQIPVIAAEPDSVERGATATYGINYHDLGKQTGEMALRLLEDGEDPATTPVETAPEENLEITVNEQAAEDMGVEIPDDVLDEATLVED